MVNIYKSKNNKVNYENCEDIPYVPVLILGDTCPLLSFDSVCLQHSERVPMCRLFTVSVVLGPKDERGVTRCDRTFRR